MSGNESLDALAAAFGILPSFHDLSGEIRPTAPETKRALLRANGLAVDNDAMAAEALDQLRAERAARRHPEEIIVERGAAAPLPLAPGADWHLALEGRPGIAAEGRAAEGAMLPALPAGIHSLTASLGGRTEEIAVIAAPPACPSVAGATGRARIWGATAALYGLWSSRNRGLGDFEDLAAAAEAFGAHGADFLGINPVHNIGWSDTGTISPYSPSHRGFLNTAHVAADRIPGLPEAPAAGGAGVDAGSDAGDPARETIRYSEILPAQRARLEAGWHAFEAGAGASTRAAFEAGRAAGGAALSQFALYEALSETHGPDWRSWPAPLRDPASAATAAAAAGLAGRLRFHEWLQWLAAAQLSGAQARARRSGMALGLYLDLAVGSRRWAAETWCEQDAIAAGVAIGAPPDHLSPDGQNWQLAGYAPRKLAERRYAPLRRILSAAMRHAGVLRIDHVLGMNRSYWIPDDGSPGGYIGQPLAALLAVVAIEAERSGTVVIGEDLGLVPQGFRETLTARGLYGYSVLQYERDDSGTLRPAAALRPKSLVCFGTHDTPTLKGFWDGRDIDWWQRLGWIDEGGAEETRRRRAGDRQALLGLAGPAEAGAAPSFADARRSVHRALAVSPAEIVSVQIDDLCAQREAQNLPGTTDAHPNWQQRCGLPVERFAEGLGLDEIRRVMQEAGRGPEAKPPGAAHG
ncbi:4-alpha-glucanotransferase [Paralimibaculum aggregatum]|uniref:4-alpha-glucanotransferase n=1 Tax=Paralimibaculum aggregatum TaxID=3036245 RepID=A0ABQ6LH70_9RHOB|nr:4-alpha-glucanotransferase [Limibaculum sp. NKW23]GMG82635.1 4-alpha-glucanotransferase [Limibaculum sp. NKW23]